eukprot:1159989-Pelagomonas_calceolata.AAC.5
MDPFSPSCCNERCPKEADPLQSASLPNCRILVPCFCHPMLVLCNGDVYAQDVQSLQQELEQARRQLEEARRQQQQHKPAASGSGGSARLIEELKAMKRRAEETRALGPLLIGLWKHQFLGQHYFGRSVQAHANPASVAS